jgi:hypothetical protein
MFIKATQAGSALGILIATLKLKDKHLMRKF